MNKNEIKKIVLAYSGGLDTSIIIPWLKENYNNPEIIAVAGNVGQADELDGLEEKALKTGASKLIVADLTDEMVNDIIIPCLKMDAKYEKYLLGTAFARPVIGKKLAEIAVAEGADAIAHGCTGKGNDQVRFELAITHFAPDMKVIAPWREWDIKSRDEEIDYAEAHNVPLKISRETNYSKDKNLWHLSHEGLDLEDPANEPDLDKEGFLEMSVSPYQAPDVPTLVSIDFEAGVPVAVNGEKMKPSAVIAKLNELGGANGIGILDAGVPVFNGLTNEFHPTQILADFLTVQEHFGHLKGIKLVYMGDARYNMGNSLMVGCAKMGMHFVACAPEKYFPDAALIAACQAIASETGAILEFIEDPAQAVKDADVIYTDVWVSMGEPDEVWAERLHDLLPYQVNDALMAKAKKETVFMHCLPAFHDLGTGIGRQISEKYGLNELEVTNSVFESPRSIVFDEAENRMHTIKAVMALLMQD